MQADLHVHTSASDGTDSPQEVVIQAASIGLGAIAIADHDTVEGIMAAMLEGKKRNVEVLPAVELSASHQGGEVHILGYMMDYSDPRFLSELAQLRNNRSDRIVRMVNRLNSLGIPITLQRVLEIAGQGSVGRPHIARALVEEGIVNSLEEAFDFYIGVGQPGYEPRQKYTPFQAVQSVRQAGGVAVLAHPGYMPDNDLIFKLISYGLQGIEVYHPGHTPEMSQYYLGLCRQHGLIATGGSDFHGKDHDKNNQLGAFTISCQAVEEIKCQARKNRENGN